MARSSKPPAPRVSIAIASYNHGRFLRENLDSLLGQSFPDFEIVVVDDGSTDDSLDILLGYQRRHPDRLRVLTHEGRRNLGMYATLNRAVHEGTGPLVAIQGSDDVWLKEKLERQVSVLDADPSVGAVYSQAYLVDAEGRYLEQGGGRQVFGQGSEDLLGGLLAHNFVPAMTLVYRRALLSDTPPFRENLLFADWDLNVRLALRTRLVYLPSPLAKYRRHPAAATGVQAIIRSGVTQRLALTRVVLGYPEVRQRHDYPEICRDVNRAAAGHALYLAGLASQSGELRHTVRNLGWALRLRPQVLLERPRELLKPLMVLLGRVPRGSGS